MFLTRHYDALYNLSCSRSQLLSPLLTTAVISQSRGATGGFKLGYRPALARIARVNGAHASLRGLSAVRSAAARRLGRVGRPSRGNGAVVDAGGLRPGDGVVGVEHAGTSRLSGRGRGRTRELAQALAAGLSPVSSLAALKLGVVGGAAVRREGMRNLVLAAGVGPSSLVVGIPQEANATSHRGRSRGRRRELAQALATGLSAVGSLAALKLGGVLWPVAAIIEREGQAVLAAGVGPGGVVVGIPAG